MLREPQAEWVAHAVRQELARRVRSPLPLYRLEPADRTEIVDRIAKYTPTPKLYADGNAVASEMEAQLFVGRLAGRYDTERQEMIDALDDDPSSPAAAAVHATRAAVAIRIVVALDVRGSVENIDILWERILQVKKPVPL